MALDLHERPLLENVGIFTWADSAGSAPPVHRFARMAGRREDTPFRPCLRLRDTSEIAAALALAPHPDSCVNEAVFAVLAALIILEQTGDATWLFYSRDNNHYSDARRYVPPYYRRKPLIAAIEYLASFGLIEHEQTRPSPSAGFRSRLRATESLRARIGMLTASTVAFTPREIIVLRDATGQPLPYRETAATRAMRCDVAAQNAFLERINITLRHPDAVYDAQVFLLVGGCRINTARNSYYRIFKESFLQCGRWYGPWWQSVPSRIRKGFYLNGEPTCEFDIRGCHIRLLCAAAGIELGDADPYDGLGLRRGDVKLAVNIMLNAPGWRSARAALVERLHEDYGAAAAAHVDLIKGAIERRFPALRRFWNTGCGLVLQNIDADICARVQRRLRERSVPALSVHDSFVVPQSARQFAEAAITEEFQRACQRVAKNKQLTRCASGRN
jgi:hypothetical protein